MDDPRPGKKEYEPIYCDRVPSGPPAGTVLEVTDEKLGANRVNALKHGRFAKFATRIDADRKRLDQLAPGENVAEIFEAFGAHIFEGEPEQTGILAAGALTATELVRRRALKSIIDDGISIREVTTGGHGENTFESEKYVPNPAAKVLLEANTQLGFTAADYLLTPKSRGEGDRDEAVRRAMERDVLLRGSPKDRMAPPPAIETSTVPGAGA